MLGPRGALIAFLGLLASPALAQTSVPPPAPPGGGFGLPVDCPMWEVCSIQNYIDHDPGSGWADHTCGHLSYDGHRGIDFQVPTQIEMRRGVPVIAAADGVVVAAHDGQPDLLMRDTGPGATRDERNGNWVAIDHGDSWATTYAHLREGSVAVKQGQRVRRGQQLGLVGLSGNADFPHVHFAVTQGGRLLDPFTGQEPSAACGASAQSLWSPAAQIELVYRSGGLLSAGFNDHRPDGREVEAGIAPAAVLPRNTPVLGFWGQAWGLKQGDVQTLVVIGPDGEIVVQQAAAMERSQARLWRWIGRKLPDGGWAPGRYRGLYRVERPVGDATVIIIEALREVEIR